MGLYDNNIGSRDQAFQAKLASSSLKLQQAIAQNGGRLPEGDCFLSKEKIQY